MKLLFKHKQPETGDIWSFFFKPTEPTHWRAGQSIRLELKRPTWGISERRFTIASAPHEGHLQITTRLSESEFKNLLSALVPGQEIAAHNIEGSFTTGESPGPVLFVAGGVGVTPYRSLVSDLAYKNALRDVVLLHLGRDVPAIFQTEFEKLAANLPGLSYQQLATRLSEQHLVAAAPDWVKRDIYLSGSSAMVEDVRKLMLGLGAEKEQIKLDIFSGNIS